MICAHTISHKLNSFSSCRCRPVHFFAAAFCCLLGQMCCMRRHIKRKKKENLSTVLKSTHDRSRDETLKWKIIYGKR
jgi:hypothetical protein